MPILELETPEATYRNNMARGCHFMIDCTCKGKDGKYSGSHYKNSSKFFREESQQYIPLSENKYEHTFYLSEELLINNLFRNHRKEEGKSPFIIVCNDCKREFHFTHESYLELRSRMKEEYNWNL